MKYVASIRRGGGENDFVRKIRDHEKFLLFIKISSALIDFPGVSDVTEGESEGVFVRKVRGK